MKTRIDSYLLFEVDKKKCDCMRELPHCHVIRNGVRVAKAWLNPIRIEPGHSLDTFEVYNVMNFLKRNYYRLEREYKHNKLHGAD